MIEDEERGIPRRVATPTQVHLTDERVLLAGRDVADPSGETRIVVQRPMVMLWYQDGTLVAHPDLSSAVVDDWLKSDEMDIDSVQYIPGDPEEQIPGIREIADNFGTLYLKAMGAFIREKGGAAEYWKSHVHGPFDPGRRPEKTREWDTLLRMIDAYFGDRVRLDDRPRLDDIVLVPMLQREFEMLCEGTYFSDYQNSGNRGPHEYLLRELVLTMRFRGGNLSKKPFTEESLREAFDQSYPGMDIMVARLAQGVRELWRQWGLDGTAEERRKRKARENDELTP
ncbi:hypothetical protein LZ318_11670 [Saccharopolyspora indica]|uniref:hypothetical protein n=1 Tax=Saccharopolyspora indica TaxID=1229659 RepID=UPI0022EB321D|nr:hypothetical protein [Saccharopolyspora indica]MDA3643831.1 hypothetical protein [Saccharopolyspora indica]